MRSCRGSPERLFGGTKQLHEEFYTQLSFANFTLRGIGSPLWVEALMKSLTVGALLLPAQACPLFELSQRKTCLFSFFLGVQKHEAGCMIWNMVDTGETPLLGRVLDLRRVYNRTYILHYCIKMLHFCFKQ